MTRAVEELARRLSQVERNVRTVGSTPQLAYSSIEDGNLQEYDADGNLVQVIGLQFDGSHTTAQFNGANPSTPSQALLTARVGGYSVQWDGTFTDGSVPSMDLLRVDVHASAGGTGFTPSPSNRVGSIMSPSGGTVSVSGATGLTYAVKLVAITQSGKVSTPSAFATVVPLAPTSDGVAPTTSAPSAPVVLGNIKSLLVSWSAPANNDQLKWNVYASSNPSFLADGTTFIGTTEAAFYTIRQLTGGVALAYGTTYYVKVWAQDKDGFAPAPSAAGSGQLVQATTADVAADFVYAGSVIADQIIGGSLAAEVTLSGLFRTGLSGQRVELGAFGLIIYDASGNSRTVLAPDASTFRGDVEADGLTVNGTASIRSLLEIAKGAQLILQSATSAPPSAPTVVTDYPKINLATGGWWVNGFHAYLTKYWVTKDLASGPRLSSYSVSTGANVDNLDLGVVTDIRPRPWGGCVHLGSSWYTIGWQDAPDGSKPWYLTKYDDTTGATQAQTTITTIGSGFASSSQGTIAIGTDGTNILQCEFDDANDRYRILVRNPTTLAVTSTINTGSNTGFTGPVVSVGKTNADFGGSRWYVLSKSAPHVYVFDGTTNAYNSTEAFKTPTGAGAQGTLWDGARFITRSSGSDTSQAVAYQHSTRTWNTGGTDLTYGAATTWRNTTLSYETPKGPVRSFSFTKRSWITITTSAVPANANQPGFYLSTNPAGANTTFFRQSGAVDGSPQLLVGDAMTFAGTNPPTTSTYPDETPAKVVSSATWSIDSNPAIELKGDGTGRLALPVRTGWHIALGADSATFSGTTYANTGLYVPTDAGGIYEIEGELFCTSSNSAGNMKLKWTYPSAGSWTGWFTGQALGVGTAGAMAADIRTQARGASGFEAILGSPGSGEFLVRFKVRMANTGSSGNINLQCCQQTAGVGGPQLRTPSWLSAKRIG